jgi:hypothetical protein
MEDQVRTLAHQIDDAVSSGPKGEEVQWAKDKILALERDIGAMSLDMQELLRQDRERERKRKDRVRDRVVENGRSGRDVVEEVHHVLRVEGDRPDTHSSPLRSRKTFAPISSVLLPLSSLTHQLLCAAISWHHHTIERLASSSTPQSSRRAHEINIGGAGSLGSTPRGSSIGGGVTASTTASRRNSRSKPDIQRKPLPLRCSCIALALCAASLTCDAPLQIKTGLSRMGTADNAPLIIVRMHA